jgi:hypothetical protein
MYYNIRKNELYISDVLFESLKDYGAIKWHKNSNHSFYIKFKDTRLGSIRISNHRGIGRYHYTYEIHVHSNDIDGKIKEVADSIIEKSKSIRGFDPNKYVVFNSSTRRYEEVKNFNDYREVIYKRRPLGNK